MGRVVLVACLTAALGCIDSRKEGFLETRLPGARVTRDQLRLLVHDAVLDSVDRIEEAADDLRAQASSPDVRRHALLWKINGIQVSFRASSRRDALGSFVDLWILSRQMVEFFETGRSSSLSRRSQGSLLWASACS